jgi:predicted dienelactone hydrolase
VKRVRPERRIWNVRRVQIAVVLVLALVTGALLSVVLRLQVPQPTGAFGVGREQFAWRDASRPETHTPDPSDAREVVVEVWYPAEPGSGSVASYVPDLASVETAFVESGEVSSIQAAGLRFVQTSARVNADVAAASDAFPVIFLSPGNATNATFYAAFAEELASHGYIVVGIEHPYLVTAVRLAGGRIATYAAAADALPLALRQAAAQARIAERVADVRFVLDRLAAGGVGHVLTARMDLSRVAIMGHSDGGITAAEACRVDARLRACLNIDGQQAGGPFATTEGGSVPEQPFMFLTKDVAMHISIAQRFEEGGEDKYRVVLPSAAHDQFSDTALFRPVNPFDHSARDVITTARGFTVAFFNHVLRGAIRDELRHVNTSLDVYVNVYPLGGKQPIP